MGYKKILKEARIDPTKIDVLATHGQVPAVGRRIEFIITTLHQISPRLIVNMIIDDVWLLACSDDQNLIINPLKRLQAANIKFNPSVLDAFLAGKQAEGNLLSLGQLCQLFVALNEANPDLLKTPEKTRKLEAILKNGKQFESRLLLNLIDSYNKERSKLKQQGIEHSTLNLTVEFIQKCINHRMYQLDSFSNAVAELMQLDAWFIDSIELHELLLYFSVYSLLKRAPTDEHIAFVSKQVFGVDKLESFENAVKNNETTILVTVISQLTLLLGNYSEDDRAFLSQKLAVFIFDDPAKLLMIAKMLTVFNHGKSSVPAAKVASCLEIYAAFDDESLAMANTILTKLGLGKQAFMQPLFVTDIVTFIKEAPTTTSKSLETLVGKLQTLENDRDLTAFAELLFKVLHQRQPERASTDWQQALLANLTELDEIFEHHKKLLQTLHAIENEIPAVSSRDELQIVAEKIERVRSSIPAQAILDYKSVLAPVVTRVEEIIKQKTDDFQRKERQAKEAALLLACLEKIKADLIKINLMALQAAKTEAEVEQIGQQLLEDCSKIQGAIPSSHSKLSTLLGLIDLKRDDIKSEMRDIKKKLKEDCLKSIKEQLDAINFKVLSEADTLEKIKEEERALNSACDRIQESVPKEYAKDQFLQEPFGTMQLKIMKNARLAKGKLQTDARKLEKVKELCQQYLSHVHQLKRGWFILDEPNLDKKEAIFQQLNTAKTIEEAKVMFNTPDNLDTLRHSRSPKLLHVLQAVAVVFTFPISFFVLLCARPSINFFKPHSNIYADKINEEIEKQLSVGRAR